jgi:hypothetical protein
MPYELLTCQKGPTSGCGMRRNLGPSTLVYEPQWRQNGFGRRGLEFGDGEAARLT